MNTFDAAFTNPSGGLSYHVSAYRWRKAHWQFFASAISKWLSDEWNPRESSLVLFGPSAGWTLSETFLARFDDVLAIEPDPIARFLLRRRFPNVRWRFESKTTCLPWFDPAKRGFENLLLENHQSAILFSNLLGQIPLLMAEADAWSTNGRSEGGTRGRTKLTPDGIEAKFEAIGKDEFLPTLQGRNWASYHDVISTTMDFVKSKSKTDLVVKAGNEGRLEKRNSIEDLANHFFESGTEVLDHQTSWLATGRPILYLPWQLKPGASHVVGCIRS